MDFIALLDSARPYLDCFDYDHYPQCFREFEENASDFFRSLEGASPDETAQRLVELTAARWKARPFWERADLARKDRTVLALFFAPAAVRHSERAGAFAAALQERWNARFPRNRFLAGDYDKIMQGFDKDFLGIKLRKSERR